MASWFGRQPVLTESNLEDQSGRVFIVTGSSGGIGKVLASFLYSKNAKVYIAARSEEKAKAAITEIKETCPASTGELVFLKLDLGDLTTIKQSADDFLAREKRLDVLWNNAGVMVPPQGSKTTQGYELQLGTNNVGPFLFTQFLYPRIQATAKSLPPNSVRIVWVSSGAIRMAPKPAIDFSNMNYDRDEGLWTKYARSKAGNIIHCAEYSHRSRDSGDGVVHISMEPGVVLTDLQRSMPWWQHWLIKPITRPVQYGAYAELFAGIHSSITPDCNANSKWVSQPGVLSTCSRTDLFDEAIGKEFWSWTERQIEQYF